MRRPVTESLRRLVLTALLAGLLPAAGRAEGVLAPIPSTSGSASCQAPSEGGAPAVAPAALAETWARLAAEAPKARAEGYRPLNTRGYNYAADARGLEQAGLQFEAGQQPSGAP